MAVAEFVPTDTVWGSLMVACGKAGQLESALRLWQGFKEARGGLQNVHNPEPCVALLIACGQTYQMQPALAILSEMKQAGIEPMHYTCMECLFRADCLCSMPECASTQRGLLMFVASAITFFCMVAQPKPLSNNLHLLMHMLASGSC